ncbi:MAG: GNAT family N-acetyltransferase [Eubacteriales bacterium]|nr:GNAT family N-acetyltransferase [Eubacteriales bacterium]
MIPEMPPEELERVYQRVKRDFPPQEYPPLPAMRRHIRRGLVAAFLQDEDYAFVASGKDTSACLLLLLAVEERVRGQGRGTALVREVLEREKRRDGMYVEVECPELAADETQRVTRQRRILFYERLGFTWAEPVEYVIFGVPMRLYYRPLKETGVPGAAAAMAQMRALYADLLGPQNEQQLQMRDKTNR